MTLLFIRLSPPPFSIGKWDQDNVKPQPGEYVLLAGHNATKGKNSDLIQNPSPRMKPGQLITILVDLDQRIRFLGMYNSN